MFNDKLTSRNKIKTTRGRGRGIEWKREGGREGGRESKWEGRRERRRPGSGDGGDGCGGDRGASATKYLHPGATPPPLPTSGTR